MIPRIFDLPFIPINSFGLMVALSLIVGSFRLSKSFSNNGINPDLAEKYVLIGGISGLIGARIWYIAENYSDLNSNLLSALFSSAGFTFYGGFIISFLLLYVISKWDKIPAGKILDACGPTLAIGYAVGRLGCQLSGDGDYGVESSGIVGNLFGMSYLTGVIPTLPGVLVYPTPFFESFFAVLIALVLIRLEELSCLSETKYKFLRVPFTRFSIYLILISLERFLVEFYRINPKIVFSFSEAQIVAILLVLSGTVLLCYNLFLYNKNKCNKLL